MKTFAKIIAAATFAIAAIGFATPSQAGFFNTFTPKAKLTATISLSQQTMTVEARDKRGNLHTATWTVSTGKQGFETPTGKWRAKRLSEDHKSRKYNDAPMPHSVFFLGGYAIHGTTALGKLGQPASHGCVRLAPENAETFFELVEAYGKWNTRIVVTD
ncbi:L,D-transpeptidase [Bauldia sp.]|uniref:L,D-transpeptidase n=1 Tax=Bauldia sp. TaxID=2575872 RepID=UPI003BA878C5